MAWQASSRRRSTECETSRESTSTGLFDQTFARQLLVWTDGDLIPDDRITAYQNAHPRLMPTSERHYYDRNIYSAAAKIYQTNFKSVGSESLLEGCTPDEQGSATKRIQVVCVVF